MNQFSDFTLTLLELLRMFKIVLINAAAKKGFTKKGFISLRKVFFGLIYPYLIQISWEIFQMYLAIGLVIYTKLY